MSISIQGSSAALATLESLTTQAGAAAGAGALAQVAGAAAVPDGAAPIVDVSGSAAALGGVSAGLATSASIADAAVAAGSLVEGLLVQMRQDALGAADPSLDGDSRAALDQGFRTGLAQIQKAIASAGVAGVNLLDGSVTGLANVSSATLSGVNLSLGGPVIGVGPDATLSDPAGSATIADSLAAAIDKVGQAIGRISAQSQAIESHLGLVAQAGQALSSGVAGQVNGGLDGDGARLAALQVQQQLTLTNASIGNTAPNAILSLFQAG